MANKRFKLLCLSPYPEDGPSVRHRILGYQPHWHAQGLDLTLWSFMGPRFYRVRRRFGAAWNLLKLILFLHATLRLLLRLPRVARFDAVIIHRECFPLGPPWFERMVTRLNPHSFFDLDDAIWYPPSNDVNQRKRFWDPERTAKIIAASHHVVVCNPFLMDYARRFNARTSMIPTTCAENRAARQTTGTPPVIVWIGNLGNAFYLAPLLPVLERLATRLPFTLRLIGGDDIHEITSNTFTIERHLWRENMEAQWLKDADIGVMPLVDRAYEQGKCAFKIVQYFAAGLPVVASNVGMNAHVVRHGDNGYLVDSAPAWEEALGNLLADDTLRRRMGQAGLQTYRNRFTREAGATEWLALLANLSQK